MSQEHEFEVAQLRAELGRKQLANERLQDDVRKANNRMQTATDEVTAVKREVDRLRWELQCLLDEDVLPDAKALPPSVVDGTIQDAITFYREHLERCRTNMRNRVHAALNPKTGRG